MSTTTTVNIAAIQATLAAHRKEILTAIRHTPAEFHRTVCVEWDGAWVAIGAPLTRGSVSAFAHNGEGFTLTVWGGNPFSCYADLDDSIAAAIDALYEAEAYN